jgi:hypothetical protein
MFDDMFNKEECTELTPEEEELIARQMQVECEACGDDCSGCPGTSCCGQFKFDLLHHITLEQKLIMTNLIRELYNQAFK